MANTSESEKLIIANQKLALQNKAKRSAELAIAQNETRFRFLIEKSNEMITLSNKEGKVVYGSPSIKKILGYTAEEYINKYPHNIIHPEDLNEYLEKRKKVLQEPSGSFHFEHRRLHKNGSWIWCEGIVTNHLNEPKLNRLVSNFRDISERKKVEEEIKNSEYRFRDLFEKAPQGLTVIDLNTLHFSRYNTTALKILKFPEEKMPSIGPIEISPEFQPDGSSTAKKAQALIKSVMRGEKPVFEWLIIDGLGEELMCELRMVELVNVETRQFLATFIDISERKRAEKQLELQNKELQKTNTELDRFVYSTSHDLRAPLASLLGLIDMATDDIEPGNELQIEHMSMMKQSVLKLDNFIEDILDYSRNVRTELAKEDIVFEDMIQEACAEYKIMEETNEFELKVDVKQTSEFNSDKRRIKVILNNLISNAIKYKDEAKEKSFVHISVGSGKKKATIIIEDNGIGIDEKEQAKIFEMFYRASKQSTGSGLGLYIVRETIDKLGATIILESEKSVGSKFTITITNLHNDENKNNTTD